MDVGAVGHINIAFGWSWMCFGFIMGMVMGTRVEQFGMNTLDRGPDWLGGYESVPRRLLRLAHVAFIMLPLLNIVFGQHIDAALVSLEWKRVASGSMIFGAIGIPLLCLAAVFYRPAKVLLGVPATAVLVANLIIAYGYATR